MKTLKELKKEYDLLVGMVNQGTGKVKDKAEEKNLKKYRIRAKFLRGCILYLETEPKFEVVKRCMEKAYERLDNINDKDKFHAWLLNDQNQNFEKISAGLENELKKKYEKMLEKAKYKNQIKTLKFILS